MNGDGHGDVVVGAEGERGGAGAAYVFDGATGTLRYRFWSPEPSRWNGLGESVSGVPDLNGDGLGDIAITEWLAVHVLDGKTGGILRSLAFETATVCGAEDMTGDGQGDILVGIRSENLAPDPDIEAAGMVYVFSGADGTLHQTLASPHPQRLAYFGWSVSGVPDLSGDGIPDIAVGAWGEDLLPNASSAGRAYVFDGSSGSLLLELVSPNAEQAGAFGASVSGLSDLNGDGKGDLVVGASGESPDSGPGRAGRAYVFSGGTGEVLFTLVSPNPTEEGYFGNVSAIPDASGDGQDEIAVGESGRVYVFDGATGRLFRSMFTPHSMSFGRSLSGVPDTNGDGYGDIIIGASTEGLDPGAEGRAYLFRLGPETIATLIESFYHLILDRKPEEGALQAWETGYFDYAVAMDVDVRFVPREMGRLFFLSDEYTTRGLSDEAFLKDCYWAFLSRYPQESELDQWLGTGDGTTAQSAESGDRHVLARSSPRPSQSPVSWNRAEVMTIFAESEEFAARIVKMYPNNPGDPSRNFVTTIYIGLLDRLADKEGLEYAASLFDAAKGVGQPPSAVESSEGKGVGQPPSAVESSEGKGVGQPPPAVESSEGKGVGQSPPAVEFSRGNPGGGAVAALTDGATRIRSSIEACRTQAKQTAREILASDEFQNLIDSAIPNPHSAIVARLYRAFLGRFPADHEKSYWTGELDAGRTTTDAMIDQFAAALEFSARLNQHFGG